jgi:hypothetical protein
MHKHDQQQQRQNNNVINHELSNSSEHSAQMLHDDRLHLSKTSINMISGAFSGIVVSIATAPLDVIKTRLIVHKISPQHQFHFHHIKPQDGFICNV